MEGEEGLYVCLKSLGVVEQARNPAIVLQEWMVVLQESCAGVDVMRMGWVVAPLSQVKDVLDQGLEVCFLQGCWVLGIFRLMEALVLLLFS